MSRSLKGKGGKHLSQEGHLGKARNCKQKACAFWEQWEFTVIQSMEYMAGGRNEWDQKDRYGSDHEGLR